MANRLSACVTLRVAGLKLLPASQTPMAAAGILRPMRQWVTTGSHSTLAITSKARAARLFTWRFPSPSPATARGITIYRSCLATTATPPIEVHDRDRDKDRDKG